jgi:pimeloyl-ACP methyl ester carboxylesterase
MGRDQVDGVNVFYREAGPMNAPVLLLLHGFPTSSFQYRELMPLLADKYRFIAPDLPGFGFTDHENITDRH